MKALSIRSPWWWYILYGGKDIENRDWATKLRGTIYIHASKWYVHREVVGDIWGVNRTIPGAPQLEDHPYRVLKPFGGCLVGTVEIVDCVTSSASPWFCGNYGFVLRNPILFKHPLPFKGALGFFEVPENITA